MIFLALKLSGVVFILLINYVKMPTIYEQDKFHTQDEHEKDISCEPRLYVKCDTCYFVGLLLQILLVCFIFMQDALLSSHWTKVFCNLLWQS